MYRLVKCINESMVPRHHLSYFKLIQACFEHLSLLSCSGFPEYTTIELKHSGFWDYIRHNCIQCMLIVDHLFVLSRRSPDRTQPEIRRWNSEKTCPKLHGILIQCDQGDQRQIYVWYFVIELNINKIRCDVIRSRSSNLITHMYDRTIAKAK